MTRTVGGRSSNDDDEEVLESTVKDVLMVLQTFFTRIVCCSHNQNRLAFNPFGDITPGWQWSGTERQAAPVDKEEIKEIHSVSYSCLWLLCS